MLSNRFPRIRFSLKSIFVLIFGIAIGYSLNVWTLRLLTGLAANEAFMTSLAPYTIEPPDILMIEIGDENSPGSRKIARQYLVAPDGTVNLGEYGQVFVAGKTIVTAAKAIENATASYIKSPQVLVDVFAYNSKVYYIVTEDPIAGNHVLRVPITGNETVIDGIATLGGSSKAPDSCKIWIARPPHNGVGKETILPVDWKCICAGGEAITNYQLMPRDRLVISRNSASAAVEQAGLN